MIRALLLSATLVASVAGCKRDTSSGLPPAKEWSGTKDQPEPVTPPTVATDQPPPATNPHAGLAGGGPSQNPHAGMDMSGGAGGTGMPPVSTTAPKSLDKLPDGRLILGPFALKLPDGWTAKPVTSSMRAAEFTFGSDGDLVVYYSGQGGMGPVQDNIDRWVSQLTRTDGKTAKDVAKIEQIKVAGQDATVVSTTGRYHAESMTGGPATDFADGELLAAIVSSPAGPYYFKGVGSKATMDANAAKFRALLSSLEIH